MYQTRQAVSVVRKLQKVKLMSSCNESLRIRVPCRGSTKVWSTALALAARQTEGRRGSGRGRGFTVDSRLCTDFGRYAGCAIFCWNNLADVPRLIKRSVADLL